jgi:hypothetical protein
MSSHAHVKNTLHELFKLSGGDVGYKIFTPNNHTVILYDVSVWDEDMHAYMRQRIPACEINIVSMNESVSGFAVFFILHAPVPNLVSKFLRIILLLVICLSGFFVFSQIHMLSKGQQESLYDTEKGAHGRTDNTPYSVHPHPPPRPPPPVIPSPGSPVSGSNESCAGTSSKGPSTTYPSRRRTHEPDATEPNTETSTIASALISPFVETMTWSSWSLFRQAVDSFGWTVQLKPEIIPESIPEKQAERKSDRTSERYL